MDNLKDRVLLKVINKMKAGELVWRNQAPYNPFSEIHYTGINRMKLYLEQNEGNYKESYWCTLNQAKKNGLEKQDNEQLIELENWKFKDNNYDFEDAEVTRFNVLNIEQLKNENVILKKEKTSEELIAAGKFFDKQNIFDEKTYDTPKEYFQSCIHAYIEENYEDKNSLEREFSETFILAEFGLVKNDDEITNEKLSNWIRQNSDTGEFLKNLMNSEKFVRKTMNELEETLAMNYIQNLNFDTKDMPSMYEELSKDIQYLYSLHNKVMSSKDIFNSLKDDRARGELLEDLLKIYQKCKNRSNVTDLILIGNIVGGMSYHEKFAGKMKSIYQMTKEVYTLQKSMTTDKGTYDFGNNYEKHPYKLALHISENVAVILNIPKEDVFNLLKTKEGRDKIIEKAGEQYKKINNKDTLQKRELYNIKILKNVTKEVALLEHPEWRSYENLDKQDNSISWRQKKRSR